MADEVKEMWDKRIAEMEDQQRVVYERDAAVEVAHWAQAVLTAWNVAKNGMPHECPLHLKLREVMIAYREKLALAVA